MSGRGQLPFPSLTFPPKWTGCCTHGSGVMILHPALRELGTQGHVREQSQFPEISSSGYGAEEIESFYLLSCCSVSQSCPTLSGPLDCSTPASLSFTVSRSLFKLISIDCDHQKQSSCNFWLWRYAGNSNEGSF